MHLSGATINSRRKGREREGSLKSEEKKMEVEENLPIVCLIQAGGKETAEGIQFLIIFHIGHNP